VGLVSLLFGVNGRINRAQYWLACIGVGLVAGLLIFAMAFSSGASMANAKNDPAAALGALASFGLSFLLIMAVLTWSSFAISVKRFHDRGQSGKWVMLGFLPGLGITSALIGGLGSMQTADQLAAAIQPYLLLGMVINLGFFINLGCLPGTNGSNKYGDPPKGGSRSPSPSGPVDNASAASALFGGAQSALDRAIEAQARGAQQAQSQPRPVMARASLGPTPAPAGGGFGKRVSR